MGVFAKLFVLTAASSVCAKTYVYEDPDREGVTFDIAECWGDNDGPTGTPEQIKCQLEEGILAEWDYWMHGAFLNDDMGRTKFILCRYQEEFCMSKYEHMTDLDAGCREMVDGCR